MNENTFLAIPSTDVTGLDDETVIQQLIDLQNVFNYHQSKNYEKERYYEGHITLGDVNLGIAIPNGMKDFEIGCDWGAKAVDVLASRSMFDGFVSSNGADATTMRQIMDDNRLKSEYIKACRDELKFGCTFATLSADPEYGCRIRFHSPCTAAALWNGEKGRIDCGLAIIDTRKDESDNLWKPSIVNLYTDTDIWVLKYDGAYWYAERHPHRMGRPMMEPMVWNATSAKPFGRSRLKYSIRGLIKGYVRTVALATLGLEFSAAPQKYLLGITDDQYDAMINDKFRSYIGSILFSTSNPDTGENPVFGQLSQQNIQPQIDMMRLLATQFSAATGLSVTDTGVVNDANPTSSDAIIAQTQTLITLAEQLNAGNGESLTMIARMSEAISRNVTLSDLTDDENDVIPHFKNPAMPSIASTADAATKIASARADFANTDIFLEMVGFDQADIRRIKAEERTARGTQVLLQEFNGAETAETQTDETRAGEKQAGGDNA